ncbi:MAG: FAD-binding oxidoreductase, partial [Burkholderiales bacterium]
MTHSHHQSWGRYPKTVHTVAPLYWRTDSLPLPTDPSQKVLPYGMGRSYGDSCLNDGGTLLLTRTLNHFLQFDAESGVLTCEAGITLGEILAFCVPKHWFLPVTPGTQFVTVGGAIANDVHGKNHHRAGTFGTHVLEFELLRSDGERLLCSPNHNSPYYAATIGGLGLTGLITWATLQLKPIHHRALHTETRPFANLDNYFELSNESDHYCEYTVAWVDCSANGPNLGRGLLFRGNHLKPEEAPKHWKVPSRNFRLPLDLPGFLLNSWTVRTFNQWYYQRQQPKTTLPILQDYQPFFYPLDSIQDWNKLYGKQGFLQYQLVVPAHDHSLIKNIFQTIANSGLNSFLAVLKTFGDHSSPGLLSFPRPGITLALDFPIKGAKTFKLLDYLDDQVAEAQGAVYPAKDARLSPRHFQTYFPQWETFANYIDPRFSSSFWRRVTAQTSPLKPILTNTAPSENPSTQQPSTL